MRPAANRTVQAAFGFAAAIPVVVGALAYRGIGASSESNRWVEHIHQVLTDLQSVLLAMETMSAAARGFDSFLEAYRSGKAVKDNGLGIDSQYFDKIFGMFQRLHKREEFAGTASDWATCKKIVERHGGNISVESEPGHGSTFRFTLQGSEHAS